MKKRRKICLVASAGGHLTQLLKLESCWQDYEVCWITTSKVMLEKLQSQGRVYTVGECNRNQPLRILKVLLCCLRMLIREKPGIVISTGAAAGCIICFLAKPTGAKIVWVDSITNVRRLSLSGRLVRHIADLFLVQWPELAQKYKKVGYAGAVI